jgi:hypothetical protein
VLAIYSDDDTGLYNVLLSGIGYVCSAVKRQAGDVQGRAGDVSRVTFPIRPGKFRRPAVEVKIYTLIRIITMDGVSE